MAYHGVLIPNQIAAMNIDSYNRSVISANATPDDLDNGSVVVLSGKSSTSGEGEVWNALLPSTGNGLTGLWMIYSSDEIVLTDARYKGLDPDPRNFYNAAGKVVSAFKPALGDIITLTANAISTNTAKGANTFIVAVNSTGGYKLEWNSTAGSGITAFKLLNTTYISLATGAIDNQRVDAYQFECVAL